MYKKLIIAIISLFLFVFLSLYASHLLKNNNNNFELIFSIQLVQAGHSRVPIYDTHRTNIIGVVLVKQLLVLDVNSNPMPIRDIKIRRLPRFSSDMSLFHILNVFSKGGSHMGVVVQEIEKDDGVVPLKRANHDLNSVNKGGIQKVIGIVTLEDILEELIGSEIIDETDQYGKKV